MTDRNRHASFRAAFAPALSVGKTGPRLVAALRRPTAVLVVVAALGLAACSGGGEEAAPTAPSESGYAEFRDRKIKALGPEEVRQLLNGEGAGYALAAELNRYPGPRHVLELAPRLGLRSDQEEAVRESFAAMEADASRLGRELVGLEAQLDRSFAARTVTHDEVTRLASEAAAVEGRLRAVHLLAHLRTVEVLTADQVRRYNELRGYAGSGGHDGENHDGHLQKK